MRTKKKQDTIRSNKKVHRSNKKVHRSNKKVHRRIRTKGKHNRNKGINNRTKKKRLGNKLNSLTISKRRSRKIYGGDHGAKVAGKDVKKGKIYKLITTMRGKLFTEFVNVKLSDFTGEGSYTLPIGTYIHILSIEDITASPNIKAFKITDTEYIYVNKKLKKFEEIDVVGRQVNIPTGTMVYSTANLSNKIRMDTGGEFVIKEQVVHDNKLMVKFDLSDQGSWVVADEVNIIDAVEPAKTNIEDAGTVHASHSPSTAPVETGRIYRLTKKVQSSSELPFNSKSHIQESTYFKIIDTLDDYIQIEGAFYSVYIKADNDAYTLVNEPLTGQTIEYRGITYEIKDVGVGGLGDDSKITIQIQKDEDEVWIDYDDTKLKVVSDTTAVTTPIQAHAITCTVSILYVKDGSVKDGSNKYLTSKGETKSVAEAANGEEILSVLNKEIKVTITDNVVDTKESFNDAVIAAFNKDSKDWYGLSIDSSDLKVDNTHIRCWQESKITVGILPVDFAGLYRYLQGDAEEHCIYSYDDVPVGFTTNLIMKDDAVVNVTTKTVDDTKTADDTRDKPKLPLHIVIDSFVDQTGSVIAGITELNRYIDDTTKLTSDAFKDELNTLIIKNFKDKYINIEAHDIELTFDYKSKGSEITSNDVPDTDDIDDIDKFNPLIHYLASKVLNVTVKINKPLNKLTDLASKLDMDYILDALITDDEGMRALINDDRGAVKKIITDNLCQYSQKKIAELTATVATTKAATDKQLAEQIASAEGDKAIKLKVLAKARATIDANDKAIDDLQAQIVQAGTDKDTANAAVLKAKTDEDTAKASLSDTKAKLVAAETELQAAVAAATAPIGVVGESEELVGSDHNDELNRLTAVVALLQQKELYYKTTIDELNHNIGLRHDALVERTNDISRLYGDLQSAKTQHAQEIRNMGQITEGLQGSLDVATGHLEDLLNKEKESQAALNTASTIQTTNQFNFSSAIVAAEANNDINTALEGVVSNMNPSAKELLKVIHTTYTALTVTQ